MWRCYMPEKQEFNSIFFNDFFLPISHHLLDRDSMVHTENGGGHVLMIVKSCLPQHYAEGVSSPTRHIQQQPGTQNPIETGFGFKRSTTDVICKDNNTLTASSLHRFSGGWL